MWSKSTTAQIESQLRDRRRGFKRRKEALERIQSAAGDLERRIGEVQGQDDRLQQWLERVDQLAADLRELAASPPQIDDELERGAHLSLVKGGTASSAGGAGVAGHRA
jgi:chromosome segregation ATPase